MKAMRKVPFSWQTLPKPFFALAPMDDVTDTVFRQIIAMTGKPDVMFTEFVSAEGLMSAGRRKLVHKLEYTEIERPLILQIWGREPAHLAAVAREAVTLGFDGIDINMGCPDRTVMKQGCGAALIHEPDLAGRQIHAVREAVSGEIPVSVKTRLGIRTVETEPWIRFLLSQRLDALTVHARTAADMSRVPARWEELKIVRRIITEMDSQTILIGNGDVNSRKQGDAYARKYGTDGIMIGRGIFHDPWLFARPHRDATAGEKLALLAEHLRLFGKTWRGEKSFHMLKKYFKIYVQGFAEASVWREKLMETSTLDEASGVLEKIREQVSG